MGFFNNRLNAQVDFFQRIRDGIPESRYDVLIPNEAGFSLPKENLRSDKHVGFDAMVTGPIMLVILIIALVLI